MSIYVLIINGKLKVRLSQISNLPHNYLVVFNNYANNLNPESFL